MRRRRRAFTLVEAVTAMTVLSTIFGIMLLSVYSMQKTSVLVTGMMESVSQQQRFCTQLRMDSHLASRAAVKKGGDQRAGRLLRLTLADGDVVTYELVEAGIERRLVSEKKVVHREFFAIPPLLEEGWLLDTSRERPLVSVSLFQAEAIGARQEPASGAIRVAAALQVCNFDDVVVSASSLP